MLMPSDHQPALRALDFSAEEQRHRDEEHRLMTNTTSADAAHTARRQERGRQQHRDGRDQEDDVAVDEVERIETEPRRDRRACGQRRAIEAAEHQPENRGQQPRGRSSTTSRRSAFVPMRETMDLRPSSSRGDAPWFPGG